MTTDAQIEANRANAQRSTGPRTPEGKARSALNAIRHGYRADVILDRAHQFPSGEPPVFAAFLSDLCAELQPLRHLEALCVETIAIAYWRLQFSLQEDVERFDARAEAGQDGDPSVNPARLQAIVRYEAHLERQIARSLKQLEVLQNTRRYGAPESAPRCQPLSGFCQVVRDLHERDNYAKELEKIRREPYNPPPFVPENYRDPKPDPRPSNVAPPQAAEPPSTPPEQSRRLGFPVPANTPAPRNHILPNEPNPCVAIGSKPTSSVQSPPPSAAIRLFVGNPLTPPPFSASSRESRAPNPSVAIRLSVADPLTPRSPNPLTPSPASASSRESRVPTPSAAIRLSVADPLTPRPPDPLTPSPAAPFRRLSCSKRPRPSAESGPKRGLTSDTRCDINSTKSIRTVNITSARRGQG